MLYQFDVDQGNGFLNHCESLHTNPMREKISQALLDTRYTICSTNENDDRVVGSLTKRSLVVYQKSLKDLNEAKN